jgi:hypothetical protein
MLDLNRVLAEYDLELLNIIAARWDVELNTREVREAAARLADAMHDPKRIDDAWARLTDEQRQVLQAVAGSGGGRMNTNMFKRLFGEIRTMGPDRRDREKPHLSPQNAAEALYYRGLIALALDKTPKTSYDTSAPEGQAAVAPIDITPENIRQADTAIVDDLASFLAFCNLNTVAIVERSVTPETIKQIEPYLLGRSTAARLALLVALSHDMGIAAESEGGWRPLPTSRRYLELRRADQVRLLAEHWLKSNTYNELWYVPGLKPDIGAGWQNDPLLPRQTILSYLELVPVDKWWPVDAVIAEVKEEEPDFQRPQSDYDSWYIRDAQTGQYLKGFETWDRVDGALLRFILVGVMNTLGLLDTAQNGTLCRLTAYGRALINRAEWPQPRSDQPQPLIREDGGIEIPRAASRYDRFQIARFTTWNKAADPYIYNLSAASLAQAARQDIQPAQIITFLRRVCGGDLPESVLRMLEAWSGGGADFPITIEPMIVLRTPTAELMETIQKTPELRRYLGVALGPTAVAVRSDQFNQLATAIQTLLGIAVQMEA